MPNKTKIGSMGEELASRYLCDKGYEILERNYRTRLAEIDIIALSSGYMVFVEVKLRNGLRYGYPREAVTQYKQRKIRTAAELYAIEQAHIYGEPYMRFDVIEILRLNGETVIEHLENAF